MKVVHPLVSATQSGTGNKTDVPITVPAGQRYDRHQLVIVCEGGTPSAGTVAVRCKAIGSSRFLTLLDDTGANATISLATEDSLTINGGLEAVQVDMTDLAGSGITGWYAQLNPIG